LKLIVILVLFNKLISILSQEILGEEGILVIKLELSKSLSISSNKALVSSNKLLTEGCLSKVLVSVLGVNKLLTFF